MFLWTRPGFNLFGIYGSCRSLCIFQLDLICLPHQSRSLGMIQCQGLCSYWTFGSKRGQSRMWTNRKLQIENNFWLQQTFFNIRSNLSRKRRRDLEDITTHVIVIDVDLKTKYRLLYVKRTRVANWYFICFRIWRSPVQTSLKTKNLPNNKWSKRKG